MAFADEPWSLDRARPLSGTWLLVTLLFAVHVISGLWWWWTGHDALSDALLGERPLAFRQAIGGQHLRVLGDGGWWRLFTSLFVHGDAIHLLVNATSVYALGRLLEPTLGTWRWLAWFFVGGVVASAGCWAVGVVQSDGASGGAFALLAAGVWLGLRHPDRWRPDDRALMGPILLVFLLGNYALGWVLPGIDALAHTFGALTGLLLALSDAPKRHS